MVDTHSSIEVCLHYLVDCIIYDAKCHSLSAADQQSVNVNIHIQKIGIPQTVNSERHAVGINTENRHVQSFLYHLHNYF